MIYKTFFCIKFYISIKKHNGHITVVCVVCKAQNGSGYNKQIYKVCIVCESYL